MASARVFLVAVCLAAIASNVAASNLVNRVSTDPQLGMFWSALEATGEGKAIESRIAALNGSTLVLLAPTNESILTDLGQEVLNCLQYDSPMIAYTEMVRYAQILTAGPVNIASDLATAAIDGKLWTVLGLPIHVESQAVGAVVLSNDNGEESVVVNQVVVTDPNVVLVILDTGLIIPGDLRAQINQYCLGIVPSESSPSPSLMA